MRTSIEIAGGGLAGLSLGLALRQRGVPVTLHEAGKYPRHRVCGEFINGIDPDLLENLGLTSCFHEAAACHSTGWYRPDGTFWQKQLPRPGLGISRYQLDLALARAFRQLGGVLKEDTRMDLRQKPKEGCVITTGRQASTGPWIGLKMHYRGLSLRQDLEMHLASGAYVGLNRVENGIVNVCGLFHKRSNLKASRITLLPRYLQACGLLVLAERLEGATPDESSALGVSGLSYEPPVSQEGMRLGDAAGLIPPFTGNGMSIALESAFLAAAPLAAYAAGQLPWAEACRQVNRRIHLRFRRRKHIARLLHPWLCHPLGQGVFHRLGHAGLLPFRTFFNLTR